MGTAAILKNIKQKVYFADSVSFSMVFKIAKERLEELWSYKAAKSMLNARFWVFNDKRRFLKQKDPTVKLRSAAQIEELPLGEILSLGDFLDCEKIVVNRGIPTPINFRRFSFLKGSVT